MFSLLLLNIITSSYCQQQLLYISTRSGNFDIYKLDLDTGQSKQLTDNPGWDWSPRFISKGRQVFYYSTDTTKNFQYRLMDLSGVRQDLQLPEEDNMMPSPDGQWYAYTVKSGDDQDIWLLHADSGEQKNIITSGSYNGRVCWKKDGSGFAFISDRDGNNEVYSYDLEAGTSARLTNDGKRQKYLAWSPDGKFLVFSEELDDTSNQLHLMQVDTRVVTPLTDKKFIDSELSWSPDGRYLAFHSKRDQGDQIYMIEINTREVRQLTTADAYHGEPEWVGN